MNKLYRFILDIFFPNRCPICKEFIEWNELVCNECLSKSDAFPKEICGRCGKAECFCDTIKYDGAFVCYYYEGAAKEGILSLKDGCKQFGEHLGILLGNKIAESEIDADAVVGVPMSNDSYKKRRYNQAVVIAKEIAEINNIPLLKGLLSKRKSAVQHSLSKKERLSNTDAYSKGYMKLDNMKIILCDDVITTGSTLNRCAELLKEMGAAAVYAAVGTTTKLKKE